MKTKRFSQFPVLLALLLILFHSNTAFSGKNWIKTYGGADDDYARSIQQTTDGGYIVAGETWSFDAGKGDIWILKLGPDGSIDWQKTYGDEDEDLVRSIQQTIDGGYIVAGETESFGAGFRDAWILKLNADGTVEWQKTFGSPNNKDYVGSIQQTTDGGYIVAGNTSGDAWILKLNADGTVEWQMIYDVEFYHSFDINSIQQTTDRGFIVAGGIVPDRSIFIERDVCIMKLRPGGSVEWAKVYRDQYNPDIDEYAESIQQTTDGGFIVAGSIRDYLTWILKLHTDGSVEWQKFYGDGDSDVYAESIQQTTDGGFIVAGGTYSFSALGYDAWIMKLYQDGTIDWQTTYRYTDGDDYAKSIQQTTDGGYIVAGSTNSFGAVEDDAWILKLDPNGYIGIDCNLVLQSNLLSFEERFDVTNTLTYVSNHSLKDIISTISENDTFVNDYVVCKGYTEINPKSFAMTYGGGNEDYASSIQQTTDGGYIVAGYTESFGEGSGDAWILKLNPDGSIEWQKTYGEDQYDYAYSIQQTTDGGYIVAGSTDSFGAGWTDYWILKLRPNGSIEWQKTFGEDQYDYAYSIQQTTDGGFIVAGDKYFFTGGIRDGWILKLNSNGSIEWQKTYGSEDSEWAHSIQQTTDRGYIVAGQRGVDAWILKLRPNGSIEWQKTYEGEGRFSVESIQQTIDGGFIVTGHPGGNVGLSDAWILKLNSDGSIDWQKTYGGEDDDKTYSIQQTIDGGYIVAGETWSFGEGISDAWILKLNSDGSIDWQKTYGGEVFDRARSIQQTSDGGYIVAGRTDSFTGSSDAWILKIDSNGDMGSLCNLDDFTDIVPVNTTLISSDISSIPGSNPVSDAISSGIENNTFVSNNQICIEINETGLPTLTVDFPICDTFLTQVNQIVGTAFDDESGVAKVELQITDGTRYVDEGQNFTDTPTWVTANETTFWQFTTIEVDWEDGVEYTVKARAFDYAGNQSPLETCTFIFTSFESDTTLSINPSAQRILFGDTLDISGKLTPLPDRGQDMGGLDINIDVISPSGFTESFTASTNEFGQYTITDITGFEEEGAWTLRARFEDYQNLYRGSESETVTLLVGASAGYAIIVQGKIPTGEGILSHNKTTNRIYDKFLERSFDEDDIYYFNYDLSQPGVDELPTKTGIQNAIETWAMDKMNAVPAPLFIVKTNHGSIEEFHIDNETISPVELDSWMNILEAGLTPTALAKKRIIILGYCYSGSFIPALSKDNRIVVTSAAEDEESYKGPEEAPEGEPPTVIRSGEFFLEELFKELGRGFSLKESFRTATVKTEDYTQRSTGTANTNNKYFDNSVQHPLLDDNADGEGTNELTEDTDDGKTADDVILGSGETYVNTGPNPVDVTAVTETRYIIATEIIAGLWVTVNDDDRADGSPWFEVRSPAKTLTTVGTGVTEQVELNLPRNFLVYNSSTQRYEANYVDFDESGKWEIYYFVKDNETHEVSPMVRSVVYKNKTGNKPPEAFDLISPEDSSKQKTILIFEWEESNDPEGNPVTYNLLIATDAAFNNVVYKKEEITTTADLVGPDAELSDLTTYYWKVEAVDIYGAITDSNQEWSFNTDNTNFGAGFIVGIVHNGLNYAPIEDATVSTSCGGTVHSKVEGKYFIDVPSGICTVTSTYNGYNDTVMPDIVVNFLETTPLNIPMFPINICNYSISHAEESFTSEGGAGSVNVSDPDNCGWTAVSNNEEWITITSGGSGTGAGTVEYLVAENTGIERTGTMYIAGQTFTVTQSEIDCASSMTITPTNQTFTSDVGFGSVEVTAPDGCSWTAESNNKGWIIITSGNSGSGNGAVGYIVLANTGIDSRTGTMTVAGQTFTVNQSGIDCTYTISPANQAFTSGGGTGSVEVTVPSGCSWTAESNNKDWIDISSGNSGSGNGTVGYTVSANTGIDSRTGTITIAGQTFTVIQSGIDCTYTISPAIQSFSSGGGTGSVEVTVPDGCSWTAESNNKDWIDISSGNSGSGNGTVGYTVSANTGIDSRTGTITIAGQTFTVIQSGIDCTYTISPAIQSFSSGGGTGSVSVASSDGCPWTATSNVLWITINSGNSGSGNGSVGYSVATNTSTSFRTGTMTVAGQTFTVIQSGIDCTYTISSANQTFTSDGGSGSVNVASSDGCFWTATSNVVWITINSDSSGSGNGTVDYTVSANTSTSFRMGTMTIAGETFTVTQSGNPDISISPVSYDYGNVNVGSNSLPQTFTVSNIGDEDLVIGTLSITGTNTSDFNIQNDACSGKTIVPSVDCTVETIFAPLTEGPKSANLSTPSNDSDTPTLSVPLSGIANKLQTVWVDFTYTGIEEAGSFDRPFKTLADGIDAVDVGGEVIIKAGTTNEVLEIRDSVTIKSYNGKATIGQQ